MFYISVIPSDVGITIRHLASPLTINKMKINVPLEKFDSGDIKIIAYLIIQKLFAVTHD